MNMGYCRFQNAVEEMLDAIDNLGDMEDLSEEEVAARNKFIRMCHFVAENWEKPE